MDSLTSCSQRALCPPTECTGFGIPVICHFAPERCVRWLSPNTMWRAQSDGSRLWFSVARPVEWKLREPMALALAAHFCGNDVQICAAGIWEHDRRRGWRLDEVLEIPDAAAGMPTDAGGRVEQCCRASM